MNITKLPEAEFFGELIKTPKNRLVEESISEGRIPMAYACYIMPEPMLMVGNLFPVRFRAPQIEHTDKANYWMSNFCCSYSRSLLESLIDGDYDFIKGLISGASCTHINRAAQHTTILPEYKSKASSEDFLFYALDTPRETRESYIKYFADDLKHLAELLSLRFGIEFTDEKLRDAIKQLNEFRALLRRVSEFREGPDVRITGTEFHKVMIASLVCPKDKLIEPMKALIKALENREPISGYRARLMIAGSVFDNPEFTELIESEGALVSCDRYCFGSIPGMEEIICSEEDDPYEVLARHYTMTCECSRMMGAFKDRHANKQSYIDKYSVDGVIMQIMKFCDLWAYEIPMSLDQYKLDRIPAIKIEHEYRLNGEGQIRTRIQAFLERIENEKALSD